MSDMPVSRDLFDKFTQKLRAYDQNQDDTSSASYLVACTEIFDTYNPIPKNIAQKLLQLRTMDQDKDADLYFLFIMRHIFDYYGEPFHETLALQLYHRAMEKLKKPGEPQLTIPTHILYEKVAMAIATGRRGSFELTKNQKWPTYNIDENSLRANILVRPANNTPISLLEASPQYSTLLKLMTERVDRMDELTMDVMHIICARWLESNPQTHSEQIRLTADDILEARGVQRHLNGNGKRYGYTQEQRAAIQERMAALSCIWVSVNNMTVTVREGSKRSRKSTRYESPALVITGRFGEIDEDGDVELWTWNVRPGDVFSTYLLNPISREVGFFPKQSLSYDPKYQSWEKRLSFYFSWQSRIRRYREKQTFIYKVCTLLDAINETIDISHPIRTRERLEAALDTLQKDNLIHSWQYNKDCNEDSLPSRKWVKIWLEWKIQLCPYTTNFQKNSLNIDDFLENNPDYEQLTLELNTTTQELISGSTLKQLRTLRGLSQKQLAQTFGVTRSLISQIESEKRNISSTLHKKILDWKQTQNFPSQNNTE